jgi:coenzyme PQQ precursor peptide PqqA
MAILTQAMLDTRLVSVIHLVGQILSVCGVHQVLLNSDLVHNVLGLTPLRWGFSLPVTHGFPDSTINRTVHNALISTMLISKRRTTMSKWTKPAATEMRFGFEVTMYVMNK